MTLSPRWLPALIALLLTLAIASARADEAADAWALGRQAYANGDYLPALAYFEQARNAGQTGPAAYYNIAVCQYKLEQYAAARQTFSELDERFPGMRSLAQYNLGLVSLQLSEPETAASHFRSSYYLSGDDRKLRAMASTQLRRLIGERAAESEWLGTVSARAGYDDNVVLRDEMSLAGDLSADSPFLEVFGTLRGPYRRRNGFRLDGGFLLLRYPDAEDFNQAALDAGALYEWRRGHWGADVGAHAATTTLGGDGFDRSIRLSTRLTRKLGVASTIAVRYRYDDISAVDAIFDGIEGSRQRFDVRYRWYVTDRDLSVTLTRETNDRADPEVSPDKNRLKVRFRYAPDVGWGYGIEGELRASEYGELSPVRDEDLVQFTFTVTRHTEAGWQLFAQFLRADNDSTDRAFSYERNQLSVGVYRIF